MKKLLYIFVALFTFTTSVCYFYLRPFIAPVSLCEIRENIEFYDKAQLISGRNIHFTAYLEGSHMYYEGSDEFLFSIIDFEGCITGGVVDISNSDKIKSDENLIKMLKELREKRLKPDQSPYDGFFVVKVEIVGSVLDSRRGVASSYFNFEAKEIKKISPIRFTTKQELQMIRKAR